MIQIHQSEVEALIQRRLTAGGFDSIEDVLLQALQDAPLPSRLTVSKSAVPGLTSPTGVEILAAFQHSPYKDIDIFPDSYALPVSTPVEF